MKRRNFFSVAVAAAAAILPARAVYGGIKIEEKPQAKEQPFKRVQVKYHPVFKRALCSVSFACCLLEFENSYEAVKTFDFFKQCWEKKRPGEPLPLSLSSATLVYNGEFVYLTVGSLVWVQVLNPSLCHSPDYDVIEGESKEHTEIDKILGQGGKRWAFLGEFHETS